MNCKTQRSATKECDKSESEKQSCALRDECIAPISLTSKKSSALLAILFNHFPFRKKVWAWKGQMPTSHDSLASRNNLRAVSDAIVINSSSSKRHTVTPRMRDLCAARSEARSLNMTTFYWDGWQQSMDLVTFIELNGKLVCGFM